MSVTASMRLVDRPRCGLALGGVGSGWFELRHDGRFRNWNICNNEPYAAGPALGDKARHALFFLVRFHERGGHPFIKILQIPDEVDTGAVPSQFFAFPYMTGIERIDYEASFPFSRLRFRDRDLPLDIELEAFSPFIPHDIRNSSLPAAVFRFRVRSRAKRPAEVMLLAALQGFAGHDVARKRFAGRVVEGADWRMMELGAEMIDPAHDTWGTQAMMSLAADSTWYLGWDHRHPYYEKLIENPTLGNVDDIPGRNHRKDEATGERLAGGTLRGSIAVSRTLRPGAGFDHTFVTAWHFPNRYAGTKNRTVDTTVPRRFEGHYYANFFDGATAVATYVRERLDDLEARTRAFRDRFFDSSAPRVVLDQVNSHLNTFLTSAWLTRDMNFGIQEGLTSDRSWGPLATIDVSLYGAVMTEALFPELHRNMMRAHARLQAPSGEVGHGIDRNFASVDTHEHVKGRLDLPSQYAILVLRGFFASGDRAYIQELWPSVKRALEYVMRERDMNGDGLPDMEGAMCTYDNFPMYGAASYVCSLWLSALAHAVAAARALGDAEAEARYASLLAKGREVFERKLWAGSHYRLYNDEGGARGDRDEGCLTDQIVGQWANALSGLGDLLDPARMKKALGTILRLARRPWGLVNCRWPGEPWLHPIPANVWADQANTCWSGVELAFASLLIYEGRVDDGLALVRHVDARYRREGLYFDHQEWGGHYFRPMSAWAILNALLGYSARDGEYAFDPRMDGGRLRLFFAFADGTATYRRASVRGRAAIEIRVHTGEFRPRRLALGLPAGRGGGRKGAAAGVTTGDRPVAGAAVARCGRTLTVDLPDGFRVPAGGVLRVVV
jgi:uncharacterized protein (DUF608 family)